jgi:threonine/homoserine/homoserine lactone efflux protein
MAYFLGAGVVMGLSAGFSPGPLLALVLSQTIRHGVREGVKIAAAPLLTDLPIILVSTLLLRKLSGFRSILGVVSIFGGLFLLHMARDTFRARMQEPASVAVDPQSFRKGAIVNALSPYPYLFWLTVGAPMILNGWETSPPAAVAFIAGFYGCLVGSKALLAVLAGQSKHLMSGRAYHYLMRTLGILLLLFAILLLRDGLGLLGLFR